MDLVLEGRGQLESSASPRFRENIALRRPSCPAVLCCLPLSVCPPACLSIYLLVCPCVSVCLPACLSLRECIGGHKPPSPSSVVVSEVFTSGRCWGHQRPGTLSTGGRSLLCLGCPPVNDTKMLTQITVFRRRGMAPKQVSEGAQYSERAYPVASGREPHKSAPCRFRVWQGLLGSLISPCCPSDALARGERR